MFNKKVRDRSHAPKNATPIVAKQSSNRKGKPYYHPSGVAFLPNSYRMITKKGHNIPFNKKKSFSLFSFVWLEYYTTKCLKNKVVMIAFPNCFLDNKDLSQKHNFLAIDLAVFTDIETSYHTHTHRQHQAYLNSR